MPPQNLERFVVALLLLLLLPFLVCCSVVDAGRQLETPAAPGGQVTKILQYVLC
jgi:hypothetical protein